MTSGHDPSISGKHIVTLFSMNKLLYNWGKRKNNTTGLQRLHRKIQVAIHKSCSDITSSRDLTTMRSVIQEGLQSDRGLQRLQPAYENLKNEILVSSCSFKLMLTVSYHITNTVFFVCRLHNEPVCLRL